jgi:hypothetical protein
MGASVYDPFEQYRSTPSQEAGGYSFVPVDHDPFADMDLRQEAQPNRAAKSDQLGLPMEAISSAWEPYAEPAVPGFAGPKGPRLDQPQPGLPGASVVSGTPELPITPDYRMLSQIGSPEPVSDMTMRATNPNTFTSKIGEQWRPIEEQKQPETFFDWLSRSGHDTYDDLSRIGENVKEFGKEAWPYTVPGLIAAPITGQTRSPQQWSDAATHALSMPVRMATAGQYGAGDVLEGVNRVLTAGTMPGSGGQNQAAWQEAEQRFAEQNPNIVKGEQVAGDIGMAAGMPKGFGFAGIGDPMRIMSQAEYDALLRRTNEANAGIQEMVRADQTKLPAPIRAIEYKPSDTATEATTEPLPSGPQPEPRAAVSSSPQPPLALEDAPGVPRPEVLARNETPGAASQGNDYTLKPVDHVPEFVEPYVLDFDKSHTQTPLSMVDQTQTAVAERPARDNLYASQFQPEPQLPAVVEPPAARYAESSWPTEAASTPGKTDTPQFKNWFGDSAVVDESGKPKIVYHGTARSDINKGIQEFDTYGSNYGLMGQGGYFTESPDIASEYTRKGLANLKKKGNETPQAVYPTYLSIKNPIDMDAAPDLNAWANTYKDYVSPEELDGAKTNEQAYRIIEENLSDEQIPSADGAEIMQDGLRDMGHDGITHIGGGRVNKDGPRHRVWIAFDPEQIKSTYNRGTFDPKDPRISYALRGFYDPATRIVEGSKQAKATGEQWLAQIRNTPGVQARHLEETGIGDWLKEQRGPVSKADLLAEMQAREAPLEESTLGGIENAMKTERYDTAMAAADQGYRSNTLSRDDMLTAMHSAQREFRENPARPAKFAGNTPFGSIGTSPREFVIRDPRLTGQYDEPHFGGPVLVHMRTWDVAGPKGEKLLGVGEIQSTLHQEGRTEGYREGLFEKPLQAIDKGRYFEIHDARGRFVTNVMDFDSETPALAIAEAENRISVGRSHGVPNSPLKGDAWLELGIKRMLQYAAENGYDGITWARSDQIAKAVGAEPEKMVVQYDQKIPSFLKKYGKKWGVQVDNADLGLHEKARQPQLHGAQLQDAARRAETMSSELSTRGADEDIVDSLWAFSQEPHRYVDGAGAFEPSRSMPGEAITHIANIFHDVAAPTATGNPFIRIPDQMRSDIVGKGQSYAIRGYHGSPHDFERFDMSKIGTGEGAQSYGHGLYFAENADVAKSYQISLAGRAADPHAIAQEMVPDLLKDEPRLSGMLYQAAMNGRHPALKEAASLQGQSRALRDPGSMMEAGPIRKRLAEAIDALREKKSGRLYEVSIDVEPDQLLDWDKTLSDQPEKVKTALAENGLFNSSLAEQWLSASDGSFEKAIKNAREQLSNLENNPGYPSRHGINDVADAVSQLQSGFTRYKRLANMYVESGDPIGPQLSEFLKDRGGVETLVKAGVPGIRYLDQGSRGSGEGTRNIVVFDDKLVKIVSKDGKPVTQAERNDVLKQQYALRSGEDGGLTKSRRDAISSELDRTGRHDVSPQIIDDHLNYLRENAKMVPAEFTVGTLASIDKISPDKARVTYRDIYGDEFQLEMPPRQAVNTLGLFDPDSGGVFIHGLTDLSSVSPHGSALAGQSTALLGRETGHGAGPLAVLAHESLHAAVFGDTIPDSVFVRIANHAADLKIMNMPVREFHRLSGYPDWQSLPADPIIDQYHKMYHDTPEMQVETIGEYQFVIREEGAAHLVELYHYVKEGAKADDPEMVAKLKEFAPVAKDIERLYAGEFRTKPEAEAVKTLPQAKHDNKKKLASGGTVRHNAALLADSFERLKKLLAH